ncbi:MAG: hypothetical protein ABSD67_19130 [Terracidiphilus sp.]|jgi:uncharacterized membrane protein YGL010W
MFVGGFFSYGNATPLLLLLAGTVIIGLSSSGTAIFARIRADADLTAGESQSEIDTAIGIFVISWVLSIFGAFLYHHGLDGIGQLLVIVGTFVLWPISAFLSLRGRGVGRNELLVGHGLIGLLMAILLLAILVHA